MSKSKSNKPSDNQTQVEQITKEDIDALLSKNNEEAKVEATEEAKAEAKEEAKEEAPATEFDLNEAKAEPSKEDVKEVDAPTEEADDKEMRPKSQPFTPDPLLQFNDILDDKHLVVIRQYIDKMAVNIVAENNVDSQKNMQVGLLGIVKDILSTPNFERQLSALINVFKLYDVFTLGLITRHNITPDGALGLGNTFHHLIPLLSDTAYNGIAVATKRRDINNLARQCSELDEQQKERIIQYFTV